MLLIRKGVNFVIQWNQIIYTNAITKIGEGNPSSILKAIEYINIAIDLLSPI